MMMNKEYIVILAIIYVLNDFMKIILSHKLILIILVKDNKQLCNSNVISLT